MLELREEAIIAAEPTAVWEVLADHENMNKWGNLRHSARMRPGLKEPNGVGAVRRLETTLIVMEERITRFDAPRRLDYDVIRGAPGYNAHGVITLTKLPSGGTHVHWTVYIHPFLPALLTGAVRAFLKYSISRALNNLKNRLEPEPILSASQPVAVSRLRRVAVAAARVARESASQP